MSFRVLNLCLKLPKTASTVRCAIPSSAPNRRWRWPFRHLGSRHELAVVQLSMLGASMSDLKLHIPTESNLITHYKCGLIAGQRVRLKKDLIVKTWEGIPTGAVHPCGEEWIVLTGITSDPVLWFRQPDGERCTWSDDAIEVEEWFEKI